ncbi:hypothetical protein [Streptomyces sp. AK02-01A]|nr:hypothetical protein [Streptomyces sp. AK02-01A]MDX3853023.1 hypothetical protein [Streptomyces sp. AK02-01A]
MTRLTHLRSPDGVAPGNGYSQVVRGTGRFVLAIEAFATSGETDRAR